MRLFAGLSILMIIICTGCFGDSEPAKEDVKDNIPSQTSYSFSHGGQDFEIIPFYEEVLDYTSAMKENPELNNKEAFTEIVFDPFKEKSSMDYLTLEDSFTLPSDAEQLEKNTIELLQNQEKINKLIKESLMESAELLSGDDTTIYLFPVNPKDWFTIDNLGGVGGMTFFGSNILIMIDPSFSEDMLQYTMAHEYHHTVNMFFNGEQSVYSLIDSIITEGKADSFASLIYPDVEVPWTESLADETERAILEELNKNAESTDNSLYNDFSHGNPAKDMPRWSNYKIGYQITQSYLVNNPDVSIVDWTKLDAKPMVNDSAYSQILE